MKRLTLVLLMLSLTFAGTAHADTTSHRQAVLKLMEVTNVRQITDQMAVEMQAMIGQQFDAMNLDAEGQQTAQKYKMDMAMWLSHMLDWDSVKDVYVDIYTEVFSEAELKEITAFYQTPLGKKMLQKMPELIKSTVQKTQAMMQQKIPEIQRKLEQYESDLQSKTKKKD